MFAPSRGHRLSDARFPAVFSLALLLLSAWGTVLASPGHQPAAIGAPAAQTAGASSTDWLTYHDSNNRSGYTNALPTLNSPAMSWSTGVGGPVYAEPLYYGGNVYVVTENDTVVALNAATGALVWSDRVATPADSFGSTFSCNGGTPSIQPLIGITGTPVIDASTSTLYVVALNSGSGMVLFAIDANTGRVDWSQTITANGFNYVPEEQRGALALANGFVYIPFGSYSWACEPPFGWLFGVAANGNGTTYSHEVEAQAEGDIWTPEGVTVDASGDLYVATGDANNYNATYNYADSVLKFGPHLNLVSSFAPTNWAAIGPEDLDLGTTGFTLLPGNLGINVGKDGMGYLLNSSNLGGIGGQLFASQVCRSPAQGWPYGAWGSISYYNGMIYVPCESGLAALELHAGSSPTVTGLWNFTGFIAGPPIIAAGAVWVLSLTGGELYALNPTTGAVLYQTATGTTQNFVTPAAGDGRIFVAANETLFAVNVAPSATGSSVTVDSQNALGQTITGYRIVLYDSAGTLVNEGYTPATFSTTSGQGYRVLAEGYGSCAFSKWSDGTTANPRSFTASGSAVTLTAVYSCSSVIVDSVDQNGATVAGYYAALSSGGSVVASGYTPTTFATNPGQAYSLSAWSYGSCTFAGWSDGVMSDPRSFTATSSAVAFTAVYDCGPTTSTITADSVDQSGATITGFYTALSSGGSVVATGFTPKTFTTNVGQTYSFAAWSYGSCTFTKWSDGVTSDPRQFTATTSPVTYTAVYDCVTPSTVTVDSVDQNGNTISGYRVDLYSSGGTLLQGGYTPATLSTESGSSYDLLADGYAACTFNHWSSTGTGGELSFTATATAQTFTAVYECT